MHPYAHICCCPYPIYEFCHPIHSCYDPYCQPEELFHREYREEVTNRAFQGYQRHPEYQGYQRYPEYQRYQREPKYQGYRKEPGEVNYQRSQIYNSHLNGRG